MLDCPTLSVHTSFASLLIGPTHPHICSICSYLLLIRMAIITSLQVEALWFILLIVWLFTMLWFPLSLLSNTKIPNVLAHALLRLRDKENLAMRRKGDEVQAQRIAFAHHHSIAHSSVHIHRDLQTMYPHLTCGFTLQSQPRCATYPPTRHKNADALPTAAEGPYCRRSSDLAEEETHNHLVFRCNA